LTHDGVTVGVVGTGDDRRLLARARDERKLSRFTGMPVRGAEQPTVDGPVSAANAAVVREVLPWLSPRPIGLAASAGTGDRLGRATPGHVRAFRSSGAGVAAIFAQQSAREMGRLDRSPQDVLDDATFGCLEEGWDHPVGADADHLKTTEDIDRCLAAGFSLFTLDPGDHVRVVADAPTREVFEDVAWEELEDTPASTLRRYVGTVLNPGTEEVQISEAAVVRAVAKYGPAVAETVRMYRHLLDRAGREVEVEVAVDETEQVTSVVEHFYIAAELRRLGVRMVSFAPRYTGRFEKGVDYIGDVDRFAAELRRHAAVAQELGPYKLSLHSGSDKVSIYHVAAEATGRLVHLKTSGTSYLEALAVAASSSPELFRHIYHLSRESYRSARASYHVSAALERTPEAEAVEDASLPKLVDAFDSRQILHVGYGDVLTTRDDTGHRWIAAELDDLLARESEQYAERLARHLGRHLTSFQAPA